MFQVYNSSKSKWNEYIYKNKINYRSLYEWGEYKESLGWNILRIVYTDNLQVKYYFQCTYKTKFFFGAFYIPNGLIDKLKDVKSLSLFLKKFSKKKLIYIRIDDTKDLDKEKEIIYKNLWSRPWYRVNNSLSAILDVEKYFSSEQSLSNNYKKNLKKSLKFKNNIIVTNNPNAENLVEITSKMNQFKEMEIHSFRDFEMMNKKIGNFIKFVVIYDSNKNPISYRGALVVNDYAWELCAANSFAGREKSCGYLTMEIMSKDLKRLNIKHYHLGAISPKMKGVSDFKLSTGPVVNQYIGEYEYSNIFFIKYLINAVIFFTLSKNTRKLIPFLSRFNY